MEEKKQKQENAPLTFEKLKEYYAELSQRYQQLANQNEQMAQALQSREFDYMSFFVSMLFKVMEHPEMYSSDFTDWASKEIEDALRSFKAASQPAEPEEEKK